MIHASIQDLLETMCIGRFQKHPEFHILKFKDHLDAIPMRTEMRQCDFFQVFITKGHNVDVKVNNTQFSAMDESLTFMAPLQLLSTEVKSVEAFGIGYMLVFKSEFLRLGISTYEFYRRFPYFNSNYSPIYLLKEHADVFFGLMEKMYQTFQNYNEDNLEILRAYLAILLFESRKSFLEGRMTHSVMTRYDEIAMAFENCIKTDSKKRQPIEYYADTLNISVVYLAECVKKATGKTAKQVLNEYVILEATSLLLQSTETIDAIADQVGYTSTSNFALFFKKHTGYTPTRYRQTFK